MPVPNAVITVHGVTPVPLMVMPTESNPDVTAETVNVVPAMAPVTTAPKVAVVTPEPPPENERLTCDRIAIAMAYPDYGPARSKAFVASFTGIVSVKLPAATVVDPNV